MNNFGEVEVALSGYLKAARTDVRDSAGCKLLNGGISDTLTAQFKFTRFCTLRLCNLDGSYNF